ncbi:MAG: F0F1 ATP synthase subunit gamma [Salinivenus sp.]
MDDLESIRRQIRSTETLHSVVRTMKVLSMTSIHQCEQAVDSLTDYERTVRLGLKAALRHRPRGTSVAPTGGARLGVVVFGSAWGMCGRFNEQIAGFAAERLAEAGNETEHVLGLGDLIGGRLEDVGHAPDRTLEAPDAVDQITPRVQDLLVEVEQWRTDEQIRKVLLFHNETTSRTSFAPTMQQLLPLDHRWLDTLEEEPWPTKMIPAFRMDWEPLFAALVRQYLFVSLYRAFAESLAGEHSSRLAAMQAAEDNAEERLDDLQMRFNRQRQNAITEELLDITSGYEALSTADSSRPSG